MGRGVETAWSPEEKRDKKETKKQKSVSIKSKDPGMESETDQLRQGKKRRQKGGKRRLTERKKKKVEGKEGLIASGHATRKRERSNVEKGWRLVWGRTKNPLTRAKGNSGNEAPSETSCSNSLKKQKDHPVRGEIPEKKRFLNVKREKEPQKQ